MMVDFDMKKIGRELIELEQSNVYYNKKFLFAWFFLFVINSLLAVMWVAIPPFSLTLFAIQMMNSGFAIYGFIESAVKLSSARKRVKYLRKKYVV